MPELSSLAVYANEDGRLEILATAMQATASAGDIVAVWRMAQRSPDESGWGVDQDWQWLGTPANGPDWAASTEIVLARNNDGRMEAAVIAGHNGEIWHAWQTEPGKDWSKWHSLRRPKLHTGLTPGTEPSTPAMMVNADGRLELFTLAEGAVWHRWQLEAHRGPWHDWHSLGRPRPGLTGSILTVGRNKDLRLELFVATLEGEVWHRWQTPAKTGWSQWSPLGNPGTGVKLLAVARDPEGRLVLVATTYDGGLWHRSQQAAGQGPWEPWTPLDTPPDAKTISSIALRRQQDGRLVLIAFPTSGNGNVWLLQQTDPDGAWTDTGRSLGQHPHQDFAAGISGLTSPFLVMDGVGQLLLIFRILEATDLYWLCQNGPNSTEWAVAYEPHWPPTGSP